MEYLPNLSAKELKELLMNEVACQEARDWTKGKSLSVAWRTCGRADWMLWLLGQMVGNRGWPNRKAVVQLVCVCARTALKYVPKGEDRPRIAIETAEKWTRLRLRRGAAYAAATADANGSRGSLKGMASLIRKQVSVRKRGGDKNA